MRFVKIVLLLLIGSLFPKNNLEMFMTFFLFTALLFYYSPLNLRSFKKYPFIFVVLIVVVFLAISFKSFGQIEKLINKEPEAESYSDDKLAYLRIFYLVERGENYYTALAKTHREDARADTIPQDLTGWRLPTYIYLWQSSPLSGGKSIYIMFLLLGSLTLIIAYLIAGKFIRAELAILSPYLLLPYLLFPSTSIEFLQTDWWALPFFFAGLYFLIVKKEMFYSLSFTLALIIRELFAIPLFTILLLNLTSNRIKSALYLFMPFVVLGIALLFHYQEIAKFTKPLFSSRVHSLDLLPMQQMLSYGSSKYLFFSFRPFLIILLISVTLTTIKFFRKTLTFYEKAIFASIFLPVFVYLKWGSTNYTDYWGITFVPLMLASLPILLFMKPSRTTKNA